MKQSHNPELTKPCSYVIEAFHRALGGRMFGHKLQENGSNVACPIASEYNLGLRPFHSNPQFKKTRTKANQNCLTNISMFSQFKAPKDEENTSMGSKNLKDGILTCWSELKHQKRKQNAIKSGLGEQEP